VKYNDPTDLQGPGLMSIEHKTVLKLHRPEPFNAHLLVALEKIALGPYF
jgi:hypothetical protein